jgi:hypothetical protein
MLIEVDDLPEAVDPHFMHSTLRERIVEHAFVGDLLRCLWRREITEVEILRSEFDAGGYDLVVAYQRVVRHIQFKSTVVDGRAANVKVNLKLAEKPSGCVIWIIVTPDLGFDHFLWFGGAPGLPLPDIEQYRVAKHTKGNAIGIKLERPNHRVIPRGHFERLAGIDAVIERLFGEMSASPSSAATRPAPAASP